ncbi:hypothetical protein [Loigolactobacillus binensis]|uniref:EcsC family protein n=1 Tax=Loigolactobacillus binensis TaxID=2559922 RepID=A0ABW3E936_9LACO|nr:hypothetical protein [Loigolactobacillus binensis]
MADDLGNITQVLDHKISKLVKQPVDDWLAKLQPIYQAGMSAGIGGAFLRYLSAATGITMAKLPEKVPNFEQISKERTQQVYKTLTDKLADTQAQDFKIMENRITGQIMRANTTLSWEQVQAAPAATLNPEDLLAIYFFGFQYGFQISFWAGLVEYDFVYEQQKLTQEAGAQLAQQAAVTETSEQLQFAQQHDDILFQTYQYLNNAF